MWIFYKGTEGIKDIFGVLENQVSNLSVTRTGQAFKVLSTTLLALISALSVVVLGLLVSNADLHLERPALAAILL